MSTVALEGTQPTRWAPAWFIAAGVLAALAALNGFTWWIELSDSVDAVRVAAVEPALDPIVRYFGFEFTADSAGFAVAVIVSAVVLSRDRSNRFAWVLGSFVVGWMIAMFFLGLAILGISGELPSTWTPWLASLSPPPFLAFITGTFLLVAVFPNGRFPIGAWRTTLRIAFSLWVIVALARVFYPGPPYPAGSTAYTFDNPFGASFLGWIDPGTADIAQGVIGLLALASLVGRYRSANSEVRHQIKWIVVALTVLTLAALFMALVDTSWAGYLLSVALSVTMVAIGIAITKYRLYEIDLVLNRALVFVGLAGFITLVYAAVVGGVGLLFGASTEAALPLSVAATVVVAIAFQPLRERMRRWANRLVYGERATPYEVLSRFSARMRDTVATEDVIPQMARLLTAGTGAAQATVWMKSGDELQPVATWPEDEAVPAPVTTNDGELSIPGVDYLASVEHDDELLGAVTVTMPRREAMTATEERLADDVAAQAGLVLRNARLTADLVDTIEQLRSSRQRLVAAQDEERRRLERNLHDGAQQQLVALKIKAAMAQQLSERGDSERAAELLQQVVANTTEAVESLRDLAHGIYPPLLEAEGLEAALAARAAKAPVAVSVTARGLGRYSPEVEAAVYFCVLEALQNIVKYAQADSVTVTLTHQDSRLVFEVFDDGRGFDSETQAPGRGLINMADRVEALGGAIEVRSAPGEGTTITGSLDGAVTTPDAALERNHMISTVAAAEPTTT